MAAKEHSFDVSSKVDFQELKNAIEQTKKELNSRFDFKDIVKEVNLNEKDKTLILLSTSDNKVDAMKDILLSKAIKRNISTKVFTDEKRESASGGNVKATFKIKDSLSQDDCKMIVKLIKESKIKVTCSNQGDHVRVTSKNIDDLQAVIKFLNEQELELPLTYTNMK